MSKAEITPWQKASASDESMCVELRRNGNAIELRNSKNPQGAILRCTTSELAAWIDGAKNGEFDHLGM